MLDRVATAVSEALLLLPTAICTYLVMSFGQTLLHRWLGHRRLGGLLYPNHTKFRHACYARGHLASPTYHDEDADNTPYFLLPTVLVGGVLFFVLRS